jgi:hypothetical protein
VALVLSALNIVKKKFKQEVKDTKMRVNFKKMKSWLGLLINESGLGSIVV